MIPNVFTPNGDEVNDYFEVTTDGTTVYEFQCFHTDRHPDLSFQLSPGFSGMGTSIAGKELKEGVYYYVIEEEGGIGILFEKPDLCYLFR